MTAPGAMGGGLRLDQAPPMSIPFSFFLTAPLFLLLSGGLLVHSGGVIVLSRYALQSIAFTHVLTLGVLTMVIFGALYQMTPVVAASPVPMVGLSRMVHACLVLGLLTFLTSLLGPVPLLMHVAITLLTLAWLGFLIPVGIALKRSPAGHDAAVRGMRLALLSAALVWFLGVWIAHGHAGARFPGPRPTFMAVHLGLALCGFVGTLITAVSFQVLPMFYMSPPLSERMKRGLLWASGVSVATATVGLVTSMVVPAETGMLLGRLLPWTFVPVAVAVWLVAPALTLIALKRRKRARPDLSLTFWRMGLSTAPVCFGLAVASVHGDDPRVELLFGFVVLFGWSLSIVHGMLYRIVPFLVWFHRFASLAGLAPVPSATSLLPSAWTKLALALHAAVLVVGSAGIVLRSSLVAQLTGVLICALALQLLRCLVHAARMRPTAELIATAQQSSS